MLSDTYPEEAIEYKFNGQLYLANTAEASLNGKAACSPITVNFHKAEKKEPAIKVSGTQVATRAEWAVGAVISIQVQNISQDAKVTVKAYRGTTANKLILNSTVQTGTYRLEFDVKDQTDKTILNVPYYIIVK